MYFAFILSEYITITLEYRIIGEFGIIGEGGGWKFLQKLIIGGWNNWGGGGVKNDTIFFLVPM